MSEVTFDEATHTYRRDDKILISVTQLMRKHGLAPDYSAVDKDVLKAAADKGTLIHAEVENYIKSGEIGFTSELSDFIQISKELNLSDINSEFIVANDIAAGRVDLEAKSGNDAILADVKTTYKIEVDAVSWQLSLYEALSGKKYDKFYCFHLGDKSKAIEIPRKPEAEVQRLLDCERKGETYKPDFELSETLISAIKGTQNEIERLDEIKKAAEEQLNDLKSTLMETFKAHGIKSYETPDKSMLITYIEGGTRDSVDTQKLKKDGLYEQYRKTSQVKPSVRITLRGD